MRPGRAAQRKGTVVSSRGWKSKGAAKKETPTQFNGNKKSGLWDETPLSYLRLRRRPHSRPSWPPPASWPAPARRARTGTVDSCPTRRSCGRGTRESPTADKGDFRKGGRCIGHIIGILSGILLVYFIIYHQPHLGPFALKKNVFAGRSMYHTATSG